MDVQDLGSGEVGVGVHRGSVRHEWGVLGTASQGVVVVGRQFGRRLWQLVRSPACSPV